MLPSLDARLRDKLATAAPSIARGERHWTRALAHMVAVELPWPRARDAAGESRARVDVPAQADVTGAFMQWLAAISGQERVSVLYDLSPQAAVVFQ